MFSKGFSRILTPWPVFWGIAAPGRRLLMPPMRCLLFFFLCSAFAVDGPGLTSGDVRLYRYESRLETTLETAGDKVVSVFAQGWNTAWSVENVADSSATVAVVIASLTVDLSAPGVEARWDSRQPPEKPGDGQKMLEHLGALHGKTLHLILDTKTGAVHNVLGKEAIIADIEERWRKRGEVPTLIQQEALKKYAGSELARIWDRVLALPTGGNRSIQLSEGVTCRQEWTGTSWNITLDPAAKDADIVLARLPTEVKVRLKSLSGKGKVKQDATGAIEHSQGVCDFELTGTALTQPLTQKHHLLWQLVRLPLGPNPEKK